MIDLIYCAGGNERLSRIAYEHGWLLGMRSDAPATDLPQTFIDIDYKKVNNFEKHAEVVKQYHPKYATVPDLSEKEVSQADIDRALQQVELIKPDCEIVLVVPKLSGQIAMLPPDVAIGYSIPTSYGGAQYPLWELTGRRIHLLGGSPKKQMEMYRYLSCFAEVMSADGNYAQRQAVRYAEYYEKGKWKEHPQLVNKGKDLYFDCWEWSCANIYHDWSKVLLAA